MDIKEKSLIALEFDKVKEKLSGFAKTAKSKDLCLNLRIFDDINIIQSELELTRESKAILDSPAELPISEITDFSEIKYAHGILNEEEIFDCAKSLSTFRLIKRFLSENTEIAPKLAEKAKQILTNKELEDKIFSVIDENCKVKHNATPALSGLYSSLSEYEKTIKKTVTSLLNDTEFSKHLQENIYTKRDDRIVFQVTNSSKNSVRGIVHDVSATGRSFYIEPEQLIPLNNKLREITSQINAEILRILSELTSEIRTNIDDYINTSDIVAEIDFHFAKARYAIKKKCAEPELNTKKIIKIEEMKHPLLMEVTDNVIPNDFELGNGYNSIIITGSNTGGKTVTIKTVGLFILMTKAGMFLPCASANIYPYKNVYADIGDSQSIAQSLSTFSSHMTNIIEILNKADDKSFVILDEICAGTDPTEGSALAKTILEYMAEKNIHSVVTTHYGELKALEYTNPYFKNASVEFDTKTLHPTYKLLTGIPGASNAVLVAQNLGLPDEIAVKTKEILSSDKDNSILVVEKLQETQYKLSQELEKAKAIRDEAEIAQKDYEEKLEQVKKEKKHAVKIIKDKFDGEINSAKAEIKALLKELKNQKNEKIIRKNYAKLSQMDNDFSEKLEEYEVKEEYGEIDWTSIKTGTKLTVKKLNQTVELISMPDKKGKVEVKMGNIITKIPADNLAPYRKDLDNSYKYTKTSKIDDFSLKKHTVSSRFDLRGMRVEDGLNALEMYLDEASLANLNEVIIIHGHGTGAMKQAVRDYFTISPYIKEFRPGNDTEGGDGVSVVAIK